MSNVEDQVSATDPIDGVPGDQSGGVLLVGAPTSTLVAPPVGRAGRDDAAGRSPVGRRYIGFLLFAVFGVNMALVAPIGLSLSLRVQQLAPDNVEVLGIVVAIASGVGLFTGPVIGMWSDRMRSRWGRRRPFALAGAVVGISGLGVMAVAPGLVALCAGWVLASVGFSASINSFLMSQADRLPEAQRGRVAGLSGVVQMVAAVAGVGLASAFIGSNFLVFLVPGGVGFVAVALWAFLVHEESSLDDLARDKLGFSGLLKGMVFSPTAHPDFAWNWLGRLLFTTGQVFATTFTSLFFASRLSASGEVADIGGFIAVVSLVGVVATAGGAFLSGTLSDRFQRRRIFVLGAAIVFTCGALIMAFGGSSAVVLIIGSVVLSTGLGVFAAVDQAIVLDVIPSGDAGRFVGMNGYSTSLAQAIAPAVAVPMLLIGVSGAEKNYGLLLIIAAAFSIGGGLTVMLKVRAVK